MSQNKNDDETRKKDPAMPKLSMKNIGDASYMRPENHSALPQRLVPPTSISDPVDPTSLVNLVPKKMSVAIQNLPEKLLRLNEAQLRKQINPDEMLCRLRLSFWDEYQRAHSTGETMEILNIVRGVCTPDYFYRWIMPNLEMVRWIVEVPKDYMLSMREMLDLGLDRYREILNLDFMETKLVKYKNDEGETVCEKVQFVNTKIVSAIMNAVQMLDNRVKGAVLQKLAIQQQSINHNINHGPNDDDLADVSMDQLMRLDKQLEKVTEKMVKIHQLAPSGEDIEVSIGPSDSEETAAGSNRETKADCLAEDPKEPDIST